MDIIPQIPLKYCKKCEQPKPPDEYRGGRPTCKECERAAAREWKRQNAERNREYQKQYMTENKGRMKELHRSWRERNIERCKENSARHYAENKEYYRQKHVKWYAANRRAYLDRKLAWFRTPEGRLYNRLNASKHRSLVRKGDVTTEQLHNLMQRQKRCFYCNKRFTRIRFATVDHVIPLSKGGEHTISNLVLACKSCNSWKHANLILLL